MGLKNHPQMVVVYGIFCASHIIHQYISYVYIIIHIYIPIYNYTYIYIPIISSLFIINPWYNHIMIMYNRYIPMYDIPWYTQIYPIYHPFWMVKNTHLCDTQVVAADNFAESLWASGTLHLHRPKFWTFLKSYVI